MNRKRVGIIGIVLGVIMIVGGLLLTYAETPKLVAYTSLFLGLVIFVASGIVIDEASGQSKNGGEQCEN